MPKLSTHYRTDIPEGLPRHIKSYLDQEYLAKLPNLDVKNPKLLVVFSGGNAAGKSTLARKLGEEFQGLVLENDAIKRQLLVQQPDLTRDQLSKTTWQYTMQLYKQLDRITPNGLVIRDGVIDWYFEQILPIFTEADYELFIIGFDISREKTIELIRQRGDTPTTSTERLVTIAEDHEIHIKRFRELYTPDVLLQERNLFDHEYVAATLRRKLKQMT